MPLFLLSINHAIEGADPMRITHCFLTLAATSLMLFGHPTVAHANPESAPPNHVPDDKYCLVEEDEASKCFETEAEFNAEIEAELAADRAQTASPGRGAEAGLEAQAARRKPGIRAILYQHAHYNTRRGERGGWAYIIRSYGCTKIGGLPGKYNDNVSSTKTYGCKIVLYEHYRPHYPRHDRARGRRWTYGINFYVGNYMNDKASQWRLVNR
jgi:hypothetical protein